MDLDTDFRHRVVEEVVRAPVQTRRGDHLVARVQDVEESEKLGGLPRRQPERADPTLELGDALLEHVRRWVHDARVDVAGLREVEEVRCMVSVVEKVRRGLIDGHRAGLGGRVGLLPRMEREGLETILLLAIFG